MTGVQRTTCRTKNEGRDCSRPSEKRLLLCSSTAGRSFRAKIIQPLDPLERLQALPCYGP